MTVIAYDQGTPSLSSTANLWVTVADTNDAVPEFLKAVYTLEVAKVRQSGVTVFKLDAEKGDFKCALLNTDEIDAFDVDTSTGDIQSVKALDSVNRVTIDYSSRHQLALTYRSLTLQNLVVSDADCCAVGPGFESRRWHGCLKMKNAFPTWKHSKQSSSCMSSREVDGSGREVNIIFGTSHSVRLFPSRLYEVTAFENRLAPLVELDLNVSDEITHKPVFYSIVGHDYNAKYFNIRF
ncbi:protocadherin Fat 4 [Trichonephila clavipes]|nr:protocadherin Fat 4 [Trichonephila clavipes]